MNPLDLKFTASRPSLHLARRRHDARAQPLFFWPVWESRKFPALLASALRANKTFLEAMGPLFGLPPAVGGNPDILMSRRRAENANRYAAESLKRMTAEPRGGSNHAGARRCLQPAHHPRPHRHRRICREENVTLRPHFNIPGLILEIGPLMEKISPSASIRSAARPRLLAGRRPRKTRCARLACARSLLRKKRPTPEQAALIWTQLAQAIAKSAQWPSRSIPASRLINDTARYLNKYSQIA